MINCDTIEQLLAEIHLLLAHHQVKYWTDYFAKLRREFEGVRLRGLDWRRQELVDELAELYGGMGSFNDYVITNLHGDVISRQDEFAVNAKLNHFRHQLAIAIGKARADTELAP